MPASKKKQDYNNKYQKEHYARLVVLVPPDWKAEVNACARAVGLSVNAWVNRAIAAQIATQSAAGRPQDSAETAQASGTVDTSSGA